MSEQDIRLSFEFFPPKTEAGKEKLDGVRDTLAGFDPEFFSVTYGAGGSTRDNTKTIVTEYNQKGVAVAPHLSFGGDDKATMLQLLTEYKDAGVNPIVALRGDMPSGMGGAFRWFMLTNGTFIRENFGDHFQLEVAAIKKSIRKLQL